MLFLSVLATLRKAKNETEGGQLQAFVLRLPRGQRESTSHVFAHPSDEKAWFWEAQGEAPGTVFDNVLRFLKTST